MFYALAACAVIPGLLVGCLTSQQHASVSQGRVCSDSFTCCHTEIEVADPTFYLTQSPYTDTGPTSPNADPIMPCAWQGSHWSAKFSSHRFDSTRKNPVASGIRFPDLPLPRRTPQPLGQRGGSYPWILFFVFCVPQLYIWDPPVWVRFLRM